MTLHFSTHHRPLVTTTRMLAFALLVVGVLLLLGFHLVPSHVEVTSTSTALADAPVSPPLQALAKTPRSDCGVTGDLVGDANPAEIYAVMCGGDK